MTWSRFDDAAPTHPKAREAGNEAWGLWCAAVMYCNRYLTDGFVSVKALARDCLPVPIKEERATKLAKLLVDAKVKPDGRGLFTETEGGYIVNDFLEWNPSKVDVESKRKADRERKRAPGGVAKDSERNPVGRPPDGEGNPNGGQGDSGGSSPARGPAPAGARTPYPSVPSPTTPPQGEAVALATRAKGILENPYDGTFHRPSVWPEVVAAGEALGFGMVIKFGDSPTNDADLRAVLELYAAGYTVDQVVAMGARARFDEFFRGQKRPGPASFTLAVARRMLTDQAPIAGGYSSEGWAV